MWGNKRVEIEEPPAAVPASPPGHETNPALVSESSETTAMSMEVTRSTSASLAKATARLGANLHVKGEISGNEDFHVDGTLEGLIQLDSGKLTVGASAKLAADVIAREIVIHGTVKGNLHARNRIEIKKEASVIGDLIAPRIRIEDGAHLKGTIQIDQKAAEDIVAEEPAATAKLAS
jgi:cytoskeletal protein CcmA (bactofilin family)